MAHRHQVLRSRLIVMWDLGGGRVGPVDDNPVYQDLEIGPQSYPLHKESRRILERDRYCCNKKMSRMPPPTLFCLCLAIDLFVTVDHVAIRFPCSRSD